MVQAAERVRDTSLAALAFLALLVGTSLVPYRFPPSGAVVGASSELGFNNAIAYVCYLVLLSVTGVLVARLLPASRLSVAAESGPLWSRISWRLFLIVSVPHVILFAALYLYRGRFVFADAGYFQIVLHRMAQGELPSVDFSYYYGPMMLYPAYWLIGIVGSLEAAYAIYFVATCIAGLLMLHLLLATLIESRRSAGLWFVFLAVGLFSPMAALNFGLVRYLLSSLTLLVLSHYLLSGGLRSLVSSVALFSFALLYSLEVAAVAIAGAVALLLIWISRRPLRALLSLASGMIRGATAPLKPEAVRIEPRQPSTSVVVRRGLVALVAAVGVSLVFFLGIDPSGRALVAYPYSFVERLGGEHNIPVYPHLAFVVVAAITVFAVAGWLRLLAEDAQLGLCFPFLIAYLPAALLAERGSIALSDPRNLAFFGLPALLIALHVMSRSRLSVRAEIALACAVLIGVMLPLQVVQAGQLVGFVSPATVGTAPQVGAAATTPGFTSGTRASVEATLTEMVRRGGVDRPYFMYRLDYYSVPIYHRLNLRYPTYDSTLITVTSIRLGQRLVDEVRASNALVIIARADLDEASVELVDPFLNVVSRVTGASMPSSELVAVVERNHSRVRALFLEYVRSDMHVVYEADGLVMLSR